MDTRRSISIVPPTGGPPAPRTKSLRQQRISNGATIIKAYVQHSEQRREQSKHASVRTRPDDASSVVVSPRVSQDERVENVHECALSPRSSMADVASPRGGGNQHHHQVEVGCGHDLDALFSERRIRRSRRPSLAAHGRHQHLQVTGTDHQSSTHHAVVKPILRRRLQMETVSFSMQAAATGSSGTSHLSHHSYRTTPAVLVPHHPRARHNLGAKLDALAKSSMLNRRKVVLAGDEKAVKNLARNLSPRHANGAAGSGPGNDLHNGTSGGGRDTPESEAEARVMTAFRQIVRLWRERKRRAEAAALNKMNGNASGVATGTGRNGSKLRKELAAQQSNVVGIISRRLIREIPALKFFDEESETQQHTNSLGVTASKTSTFSVTAPERAKPRGVCYTLDAFGCRKIKMQSSTTIAEASRQQPSHISSHKQQKTGSDELTLEKAMHRSLHRKMARRIKSRRQSILRLGDEFSKSRNELAMKLRSQLALQHAQIEKMFRKRLALLLTDDTTLPSYKAQKELHLARVRCRKANLLERCETLRVLGMVLRHVEAAGSASGLEVSTGELHFLDLFRCVVEENHVLTPIISTAIRQHMRAQDLKQPVIMELFDILDNEMHRSEHTIYQA